MRGATTVRRNAAMYIVRMPIRTVALRGLGFAIWIAGQVAAFAQPYVISTVAGGGPLATPVEALQASLGFVSSIVTGPAGDFYFFSDSCIFKLDAKGILTRVAGTGRPGYSGDGGPALDAQLGTYGGVAADVAGNVYFADGDNRRVRMIAMNGVITTVAGSGTPRGLGDGGPATAAQLSGPEGVAADGAGNLYIADMQANRVRKVTAATGTITTVAGNGSQGYSGDGGPAANASLFGPAGVAVDGAGNVFIAESYDFLIRKVTAATGVITTVAGGGKSGPYGDGGAAPNWDPRRV